jgi:hypothetical protein
MASLHPLERVPLDMMEGRLLPLDLQVRVLLVAEALAIVKHHFERVSDGLELLA